MQNDTELSITEKLKYILQELRKIKEYCKQENIKYIMNDIFIDGDNQININWSYIDR